MSKVKLTMNVAKFNDTMRASKELAHYLGVDGSVFDKWKTKGQSLTTHTGKTLTLPRPYDDELKDNYLKRSNYTKSVCSHIKSVLGEEVVNKFISKIDVVKETLNSATRELNLESVPFRHYCSDSLDSLNIYFNNVEKFKSIVLENTEVLKQKANLSLVYSLDVFDTQYI